MNSEFCSGLLCRIVKKLVSYLHSAFPQIFHGIKDALQ